MVLVMFGLRNPDNTNTNSEHVHNMDSHFKDNFNLLSFHPCIFMIKIPLEQTFYGAPLSKSKNPSFRPIFSWCWCSSDYIIRTTPTPILNMFVACIVILRTILIFLTLILVFLWFYLTWIDPFFVCFWKQNSKLLKWERLWLLIIHKHNPDYKIRTVKGHF